MQDTLNGPSFSHCCDHEQEIQILQLKLKEVHHKLIDQLDICKQQQLRIIELTQHLAQSNVSSNNFDTFNYQSFGGHQSPPLQENVVPNHYNHDSRQSNLNKQELLQADLEAMRNKVLAEITERNKLKQDLKELKTTHKKDLTLQQKRYDALQTIHSKLEQQHQHLAQKYEKIKRSHRSESDIDQMSFLIAQLEGKYAHQKQSNRQLQTRCRELEQQLFENQFSNKGTRREREQPYESGTKRDHHHQELYENCSSHQSNSKRSVDSNTAAKQQKQIDFLKGQIQKINSQATEKPKKRGFEQTKDLIKKLEQTQTFIRRNRKPI